MSLIRWDPINADGIRCEEKDGVLTVHIPKTHTEKTKPKRNRVEQDTDRSIPPLRSVGDSTRAVARF